jgi:hypothetical protein
VHNCELGNNSTAPGLRLCNAHLKNFAPGPNFYDLNYYSSQCFTGDNRILDYVHTAAALRGVVAFRRTVLPDWMNELPVKSGASSAPSLTPVRAAA